jgi:hypothetical protein
MADNKLNYQQARRIRKSNFSDMVLDQLAQKDTGIVSAIGKTISLRSQARIKGIKEKFDPLNVIRFMTGGSRFVPALFGKLTGRSQRDIDYFTGRTKSVIGGYNTADKLKKLPGEGDTAGINEQLSKIYSFLKNSREEDIRLRELEKNSAEEIESEKQRRHKEFLAALTGTKFTAPVQEQKTAEPVRQEPSVMDYIAEAFSIGRAALPVLANIARFFMFNPIGLGLLAGASLLMLLENDKNPEATTKSILGAMDPGAESKAIMEAAESTDAVERKRLNLLADRPSEDKASFLTPWKDKEMQDAYLKKIGWDEKSGTTEEERRKGFSRIDSEGRLVTPVKPAPEPTPAKNATVPNESAAETKRLNSVPNTTPTAVPEPAAAEPKATPVSVTPKSSPVSNLTNQVNFGNIEAKNQNVTPTMVNKTVNNVTKTQPKSGLRPIEISVRNDEPTFMGLIVDSTRMI